MSPRILTLICFLGLLIAQAASQPANWLHAEEQATGLSKIIKQPNHSFTIRISDQTSIKTVNQEIIYPAETPVPPSEVSSDTLYWVISTRHLPHNITGCPEIPTFCLMKRNSCGQLVPGTMAEFQAWLTPGDPIMLMAHGSFVDWELSVKDAHGTYCWMKQASCGRPVKMIFWSWPSDGPYSHVPTIDVVHSGKRAAYDGVYLSYLIDCMPASSPITLLGHSHGSRVIASALHFRAGGEIHGCCRGVIAPCRRIRVIFAAAAFDHHWLNPGNRYGCALTQMECFVNLVNRHDAALVVYPLVVPFSGRSIARTGFTRFDLSRQGGLAYRTIEYDVTREIGVRHTWPNYYESMEIGNLLAPYVFNWGTAQYATENSTPGLSLSKK